MVAKTVISVSISKDVWHSLSIADISVPLLQVALKSRILSPSSRLLRHRPSPLRASSTSSTIRSQDEGWSGSESEEEDYARALSPCASSLTQVHLRRQNQSDLHLSSRRPAGFPSSRKRLKPRRRLSILVTRFSRLAPAWSVPAHCRDLARAADQATSHGADQYPLRRPDRYRVCRQRDSTSP